MSVTLFGHWICPYSVRVSFALAERGIDHDLVEVPPTAARPKGFVVPAEFVERSPRGEIPMIRIDGEYLTDSIPILELLEERIDAPSLFPLREEDQSVARSLMAAIDANIFTPMIRVYYGVDSEHIAKASDDLTSALAALDTYLADHGWLVGEAPSLAEAVLVPVYVRLEGLRRLGFVGELTESVAAHRERTMSLSGGRAVAWTDAMTDEFVRRFETFRTRQRPDFDAGRRRPERF